MHETSMIRMEWFIQNYLSALPPTVSVLDVGSYGVNRTYKELFEDAKFKYTGLDMAAGPNVDIVVDKPYYWHMIPDETFDVVISGQAFEHIEFFWFTMNEIVRVLKLGGLICIIAPRGFGLHRYPIDAYRFDTDGMIALARYANLEPLHASRNLAPIGASPKWYSKANNDAMLVAKKPLNWTGIVDYKIYEYTDADTCSLATGFIKESQQHL